MLPRGTFLRCCLVEAEGAPCALGCLGGRSRRKNTGNDARGVLVDRAILCKGSTFGFHSAGKLHAGAVGHRRRAGRCAVQRLPGTEEPAHRLLGPAQAAPPRRGPSHQGYCGRTVAAPFAPPSVPLAPADKSTPGLSVTNGVPGGAPCNHSLGPRSAHRLLRPTPCAETQQWARHAHSLAGGETGNMTARPHWQAASQSVRRHTTVGVVPCPSISTNKKKRRPHRR